MHTLTIDIAEAVALITLNDPARRNALTRQMVDEIKEAFDQLERDPGVRACVITGAGSAFCAGADFELLKTGDPAQMRQIYDGFLRVRRCPLPTIAAVNGPATGAGLNLVLACDVCITVANARFASRFLDIGLHPGGGHGWMLANAVGPGWAKAMLLFNEELNGEDAVTSGLSIRCVAPEKLLEEAMRLARRVATVPRALLERTKATLDGMAAVLDHDAAVDIESEAQAWSVTLPFFRERVEAVQRQIAARSAAQKPVKRDS
jgi:enoyl-CoA hydratase